MIDWESDFIKYLRACGVTLRTEKTYVNWVRKYMESGFLANPRRFSESDLGAFLNYLKSEKETSSSSLNQARYALLKFAKSLSLDFDEERVQTVSRNTPHRNVASLSSRDCDRLIDSLEGDSRLLVGFCYGSGLRASEVVGLRIRDIDLARRLITVGGGPAARPRVTVFSSELLSDLEVHIEYLTRLFLQDQEMQIQGVWIRGEKAGAQKEQPLDWQWVFPSRKLYLDPRNGKRTRHHITTNTLRGAIRSGCEKAGLKRGISAGVLRDSFGAHLLRAGVGARDISEIMGLNSRDGLFEEASKISSGRDA
ncbi:site-specific recombinase, phage integrase family protein [Verrucomicrobiia bacterium DG1235]|nr:site-specific recombinase, phage integrase family protein [Verrucomicrobiae bacterium DG1235]